VTGRKFSPAVQPRSALFRGTCVATWSTLDPGSVLRASHWVPLALVAAPLAACAIGVRLNLMVRHSPERGLTAAKNR
jgi:hypothetical protein